MTGDLTRFRGILSLGSAIVISAVGATNALAQTVPGSAEGHVTSALSWTRLPGAEGCLDAGALARAVDEELGRSTFVSPAIADMTVEGRIEPDGDGFRATLLAINRAGERIGARELRTQRPDCTALNRPLALVTALMIDPEGRAPEGAAGPGVEVRTVVVRVEPHWGFNVGVGARLQLGMLPALSPGAELELRVEPPGAFPIALFGGFFAPADATADDVDDRGISVGAFYAGLGACPRAALGSDLALEGCARILVGMYDVTSRGFDAFQDVSPWLLDVEARAALVVPLGSRLVWRPGVGAVVPLHRPELSYSVSPAVSGSITDMSVNLFSPWWVSVTLDMVLAVRFD